MNLSSTPFAPLSAHLLDLLDALEGLDIPLTLVGGFGLFLRRQLRAEQDTRTLIERVPEARATEDFDVLLQVELLADANKMQALHRVLVDLDYTPKAAMFQFVKTGTAGTEHRDVKVDLLCPEPEPDDPVLSVKYPRVKAKGGPLHARVTPEAIAVHDELLEVKLEGLGSDGRPLNGVVWLPNIYTLLIMKVYAFRDEHKGRKAGDRTPYAAKHVQDLFTLVSLLTPNENDALVRLSSTYSAHPAAVGAAMIVTDFFSALNAPGSLRLRDSLSPALDSADLALFLSVMRETFPA